jgi:hypothetical protein
MIKPKRVYWLMCQWEKYPSIYGQTSTLRAARTKLAYLGMIDDPKHWWIAEVQKLPIKPEKGRRPPARHPRRAGDSKRTA